MMSTTLPQLCLMLLFVLSCTQLPQDNNGSKQRAVSSEEDSTAALATIDAGGSGVVETLNAKVKVKAGSFKSKVTVSLQETSTPSAASSFTTLGKAHVIKVADSTGSKISEITVPLEVSLKDITASGKDTWVLIIESDGTKGLVKNFTASGGSLTFKITSTDFTAVLIEALSSIPSDITFTVDENGKKNPIDGTATTYELSVVVTGLTTGKSLVMQEEISAAEITFSTSTTQPFAKTLASGASYLVTVKTQPTGQTCTVTSGRGTISAATTISVACTTSTFALKASVTGLTSGTLTVREANTGVSSDTAFTSSTSQTIATLAYGSSYTISVQSQPTGQTCSVSSGTGTITAATTVSITCSTATYTLSVSVSGLGTSKTAVIREAGIGASGDLTFTSNTTQSFATTLAYNTSYTVSVQTQPSAQTCTVASSSGSITSSRTLSVSCSDAPRQISAGDSHVCYKSPGGDLKCWGNNSYGQLGLGNTTHKGDSAGQMGSSLSLVSVGTGRTVSSVATGYAFTCVILDNGSVKCWGYNDKGHLGYGDTSQRGNAANQMGDNLPTVSLPTGRTATQLALAYNHAFALLDNGTLTCWGNNESMGRCGLGNTSIIGDGPGEMGDNLGIINLGTGRTVTQVSAAGYHACALLDNGMVKCWGAGGSGANGIGNTNDIGDTAGETGDNIQAVDLGTGRTATQISGTCALLDNGTVKCWGENDAGQCGQGDTNDRGDSAGEMGDNLPAINLGTGRTAKQIAAGASHVCAILDNDTVKCWGGNWTANNYGSIGSGASANLGDGGGEMGDSLPTVDLGTGRTAKSLTAGTLFTCAVLDDNSVKCWGYNGSGQLGQGHSNTLGDGAGEMGDNLTAISLGTMN